MTSYLLQETDFGTEIKTQFISAFEATSSEAVVDVWTVPQTPIFIVWHADAGTPIELTRHTSADSASKQMGLPMPSTAIELQARLRARWSAIVTRAQKLEIHIPDPVQAMIDLLGNLPGNYDTWREIIEEPYG